MRDFIAKIKSKRRTILKAIAGVGISVALVGGGYALSFVARPAAQDNSENKIENVIEDKSNLELPETITTTEYNDQGELVETTTYPYVESVDGGQFMDEATGLSVKDLTMEGFNALGAIEQVDTSSPQAFINSTLGRCIIADNYYGAQCVSLQRAFWWDYAGYDVTTCGTGVAKGEAQCPDELARDKFKIVYSVDDIIVGTWIITDGSWTGHVCFVTDVLGNGYVSCLGENQGGKSCGENVGGSATNIINLSTRQFLVGFVPKSYILPPVQPILPDTSH